MTIETDVQVGAYDRVFDSFADIEELLAPNV
jgi:hypothetical protein